MGNPTLRPPLPERVEPPKPTAHEQRAARLSVNVVAVVGGVAWANAERVLYALDYVHQARRIGILVHLARVNARGDLPLVEELAHEWARGNDVQLEPRPLDRLTFGERAEAQRNLQLISAGLTAVVKFGEDAETFRFLTAVRDAGVPVWEPFPHADASGY